MAARPPRDADALHAHAREQTGALLRRLAFQVARTSKLPQAEAVHDLRVSMRRLIQCLVVFEPFLPQRRTRKIRRKLKGLMKAAAEVRNRDIALQFLETAGFASAAPVVRALAAEREAAEKALREALKRWSRRHSWRKWRANLDV